MMRTTSFCVLGLSFLGLSACSADPVPGPAADSGTASSSASSSSSGGSSGTSSGASGSTSSSGTPAGGAQVVASINGESNTFTQIMVKVNNAPQLPPNAQYTALTAAGPAGTMSISFTGDKIGTFTCGSGNNVKVGYATTSAVANSTVCTIAVTTFDGPGGKIAGTFSGSATASGNKKFEITAGTFTVDRPAE